MRLAKGAGAALSGPLPTLCLHPMSALVERIEEHVWQKVVVAGLELGGLGEGAAAGGSRREECKPESVLAWAKATMSW